MDKHKYGNQLQRHLANLKLVSRLLGHELHSQGGAKQVTLTREGVVELQTTIDLFIEEAGRGLGGPSVSGVTAAETNLVAARN